MLIGGSLMYTIDSNTTPARVYGYSVLMDMGVGLRSRRSTKLLPEHRAPSSEVVRMK